ncbi:polysaccharide biosynthesis protein [Natronolimnobius sp. AArcel1]|uniref:oligosaccharide flippase family protein n=1 Tax=Natronolimnobius sp. AArcel1 TaxID=1679093 RepID=UPI0013EA83D3|nr:oligosaccharide flippase family protein [Natronolimnobius sp. AArcel1]NGM67797.1 polysaccharide biosynthesis protein [Natronolimnobius sp. AArcel1]
MRLGQTSAIYFISKFAASALGFIATIVFIRLLGEEVYGFYAVTLALVSWLGIIKSVGFGQAIVKRMSESEEVDAYFAAGTMIKVVLTATVAGGVYIFRDYVDSYVGQSVAELVILLLVVTIFSELVSSALKGTHRVHIYAPLKTLKEGAQTVAMIALVLLGWGLTGMLIGHAVGITIVAALGLLIVRPSVAVPRWHHIVRLFDFAKYAWIGKMQKKTFSDMDILVLGFFVPAGLTGIYAVAYSLAKFLEVFGSAISTTFFPEISKLSKQDDTKLIGTLTNDALTFSGLFLVPGVVGAMLLGDRLLLVYGPGLDIGAHVLVILLVAVLIYTYSKQLFTTLNAIDRPDLAFRANATFIVANIVLNIVLVYSFGWVGAAIATALSATVGFVLSLYYTRKLIDVHLPYIEVTRQWLAALLMGVVVYAAREVGETHPIEAYNEVFVVLLVALGAGVYFAVLLTISSRLRTAVSDNLPFEVPLAN